MAVANRFDLEAVREEERRKREAEKIRKIMSYVVMVVVFAGVAIGAKVGWDAWQTKKMRQAEAQAAEEARQEQERAKKQREREAKIAAQREAAAQKKAEEKARREKERAERQAEIERKARERQEAAEAKKRAKEEAELEKARQAELKAYADDLFSTVRFALSDHVDIEVAYRDFIDLSCTDTRWMEFSSAVLSKNAQRFFDLLKKDGDEVPSEPGKYPEREVQMALRRRLDGEKFPVTVTLKPDARIDGTISLYTLDPEKGLVFPEDAQEVKDGRKVVGWSSSFVYGARNALFVMNVVTAGKIRQEWARETRSLKDLKKHMREEDLKAKREAAVAKVTKSIQMLLATPPPKPEPEVKKPEKKEPRKIQTFKGPDNNMRNNNSTLKDVRRL